ncbi:MAG: DUF839 domain-containing protein [Fimbriimonadaceae bacterium]|nr:DUF839 domain-containing protein [Fimbriimonadaceae bacterium]
MSWRTAAILAGSLLAGCGPVTEPSPTPAVASAWDLPPTWPRTTTAPLVGPRSAVVALSAPAGQTIGEVVARVASPLEAAPGRELRSLPGLTVSVVARWGDRLSAAADSPWFGTAADYTTWFGDGWNADWSGDRLGSAPAWQGSSQAGWLWVNHEYFSNDPPRLEAPPTGQHLLLADALYRGGALSSNLLASRTAADLDTYLLAARRELGGSWLRAERDAAGRVALRPDPAARRYDNTSRTLLTVTGLPLARRAVDDQGAALPAGVVPGTAANCSGGQTPWGTVLSGEENTQDVYGDLEPWWGSDQQFRPGRGGDPGGPLQPAVGADRGALFSAGSHPALHRDRDWLGYVAEFDPGLDPGHYYTALRSGGDGRGHRKLGALGRARWENCTVVVGQDGRLLPGQPLVLYAADDRKSGRIFKFVSREVYQPGMTRGEVRGLLDDGQVHVAHFSDLDNSTGRRLRDAATPTAHRPGRGVWLTLSLGNQRQAAPNGAALGRSRLTVGSALADPSWNGLGGFPDDAMVRRALFTACNKLGVRELNRPEDVEWHPWDPAGRPRLYIACTKHEGGVVCDPEGRLLTGEARLAAPARSDALGLIWALEEADPAAPGRSGEFTFWAAWEGSRGPEAHHVACPDNLLTDPTGALWFGTDGNLDVNQTADGLFRLELDEHQPRYGEAVRVLAMPSDAECTGPSFTPDRRTLFVSVQHPGEEEPSAWPGG